MRSASCDVYQPRPRVGPLRKDRGAPTGGRLQWVSKTKTGDIAVRVVSRGGGTFGPPGQVVARCSSLSSTTRASQHAQRVHRVDLPAAGGAARAARLLSSSARGYFSASSTPTSGTRPPATRCEVPTLDVVDCARYKVPLLSSMAEPAGSSMDGDPGPPQPQQQARFAPAEKPRYAPLPFPGLGNDDLPGFSVETCPERMPDLTRHRSMAAEVLRTRSGVYTRLKRRTTPLGAALARCIKPGMDCPNTSFTGVVACDVDCYRVFSELFSPIVDLCHPRGELPLRIEGRDPVGSLEIDPAGGHAVSVRVECSRNFEEFRFPPSCDRGERVEVERALLGAFRNFSDPRMCGRYYPLRGSTSVSGLPQGMTAEEEQELGSSHLLFQAPEAHETLSAGVGRHWPEARGVFVSSEQGLIAWVNEEDHLKVAAVQGGGDLPTAFALHAAAMDRLDGQFKGGRPFAFDSRWGYLTVCPSNLGVRMVVTLRLPRVSSQPGFLERCNSLGLAARRAPAARPGLGGEWEVRNADQLRHAPADLLAMMVLGCSRLVRMEETLERATAATSFGVFTCLPGLGDGPFPGFSIEVCPETLPDLSDHWSTAARVLSQHPGLYQELRQRVTRRGLNLATCIKPMMDKPTSRIVGLVAADAECYSIYRELFDLVMQARHANWVMGEAPRRRAVGAGKVLDVLLDPTHVRCVSVECRRNLEWFRFLPACDCADRREVERLLCTALLKTATTSSAGKYYPLAGSSTHSHLGLTCKEEEELDECGFTFDAPQSEELLSTGIGRQWPDARGVFLSSNQQLVAWINEEDHLLLTARQDGGALAEAYLRLTQALRELEQVLKDEGHKFAWDSHFGHLAVCPGNAGIRATVTLSLPRLANEVDFRDVVQQLELQARPARSKHAGEAMDESLWEVSNRDTWEPAEVDLLNKVTRACQKLLEKEASLEKLYQEKEEKAADERKAGIIESGDPFDGNPSPDRMVSSRVATVPKSQPSGTQLTQLPCNAAAGTQLTQLPRNAAADCPPPCLAFAVLPGLGLEEYPGFPTEVCPEDLPGLAENTSLAARVLRQYPQLYGRMARRATKRGTTFARVIKPAMDHPQARGIFAGACAGDAGSYDTFAEFFESLVQQLHGSLPVEVRPAAACDLSRATAGFIDPGGSHAIGVCVRVSRNLERFRFTPASDLSERREVESLLKSALVSLSGEATRGNYYHLHGSTTGAERPCGPFGMTAEEEHELAKHGAMFHAPTAMEALASGMGKHWPEARGVFLADSRHLAAWCNEEEQLQLLSWQSGGDLGQAFLRLHEAARAVEENLRSPPQGGGGSALAFSRRLGYLTAFPRNLGVDCSVTLQLPLLSSRPAFFETLRSLGLRGRLAAGSLDRSESTWEVMNERRLGTDEAEVVGRMVAACARLVAMEEGLLGQQGDAATPSAPPCGLAVEGS